MKNINFFNKTSFEMLIETNSMYLFDCLLLYGLDKKVLQNKKVLELIIKDFKKNYNVFCKYPTDYRGQNIPFNVYDLKNLFLNFIDNSGNYSRSLNNENLTLKVIDENIYEEITEKSKNEDIIEIKKKYVDNLEMERVVTIKRGLNAVYRENSLRNTDMITFNNIVEFDTEYEKNKILILPEKINTLDSGIILSGNSKKYSKDKDFRNYSEEEKNTIISALLKIYDVPKKELERKDKQKILL